MVLRPDFISELVRGASEIDKLNRFERGWLLRRAASTIKACREHFGEPAGLGSSDIVFELEAMASIVEIFPAAAVSSLILEAADWIRAVQEPAHERSALRA